MPLDQVSAASTAALAEGKATRLRPLTLASVVVVQAVIANSAREELGATRGGGDGRQTAVRNVGGQRKGRPLCDAPRRACRILPTHPYTDLPQDRE